VKTLRVANLFVILFSTMSIAQANLSSSPERVTRDVYEAVQTQRRVAVLVGFRNLLSPGLDLPSRRLENSQIQNRLVSRLNSADFVLTHRYEAVSGMAGEVSASGLVKLVRDQDVLGIDLDRVQSTTLARSIPLIHAEDQHAHGFTGIGIKVALLDSGVDSTHPDLGGTVREEQCFCTILGNTGCCPNGASRQQGPGSARDDVGHGTEMAGILASHGAAQNVSGTVTGEGVAPDAQVIAVRLTNAQGQLHDSDAIGALDWIITNETVEKINVVNMSFGTPPFAGICSTTAALLYEQAIRTLKMKNVVVFASAGNDGSTTGMSLPACTADAIAVGAVYSSALDKSDGVDGLCADSNPAPDQVACFSNSDTTVKPARPDLLAPGCEIVSTRVGGGTSTGCGTSEATAHASAAAALLLQANPSLTPAKIKAALRATAVPVTDSRSGSAIVFGRIDLSMSPDLAFESSRTGRSQVWDVQTFSSGKAHQVTVGGGGNQESRGANWAVAVDSRYVGTMTVPTQGRIVYQFGAPGVRGLHLIRPSDPSSDVQLLHQNGDDRDPSWSPDGRFIAYASQPSGGSYGIYIYDTNGTPDSTADDSQYLLLSGPGAINLRPAWSPDFNSIAFVTAGGAVGSHAQIATVPVRYNPTTKRVEASGAANLLTNNTFTNFDPNWSPDSQQIAYSTTRTGNVEIFAMSATSGETQQEQVTKSSANDGEPAWSPDGKLIAFSSGRSGVNQIYVISPLQTEGPKNPAVLISDKTADDEKPAWRTPRRWFTIGFCEGTTTKDCLGPPSTGNTIQFNKITTGDSNVLVTGRSDADVTWTLTPAGVGTISADGLYTYPTKITKIEATTATATSVADSTRFGAETIAFTPIATLKPFDFDFGNQKVGVRSNTLPVKLTNTGTFPLKVSQISLGGVNKGDFSQTNNCPLTPKTLLPDKSCVIKVVFTPAQVGKRHAGVLIMDNVPPDLKQAVILNGTGTP